MEEYHRGMIENEKARVVAKRIVPLALRVLLGADVSLVPCGAGSQPPEAPYDRSVVLLEAGGGYKRGAWVMCNASDLVQNAVIES